MTNYIHTTASGTSRRRAKSITINNPAQPLTAPEPVLIYDPLNPTAEPVLRAPDPPTASVTFVMEDRIIMADGSEVFVPAGNLIISLDEKTLAKKYPSIDADTGVIDESKPRYGAQILQMIVDGLEDVFITEGMARDSKSGQA